eukprot:1785352-Amphidinium_carterae.1
MQAGDARLKAVLPDAERRPRFRLMQGSTLARMSAFSKFQSSSGDCPNSESRRGQNQSRTNFTMTVLCIEDSLRLEL